MSVSAGGEVDRAIGVVGAVRLERHGAEVLVACAEADVARATVALALAGVEATPVDGPATRPALRTAVVSHLEPFRAREVVDVVYVRRPPLGESIALLREATRDLFNRRERERRAWIAALLRERDCLLAWRRVVFASAALLRAGRLRGVRPLVFDRDGAAHARERTTFASAGALAKWIAP